MLTSSVPTLPSPQARARTKTSAWLLVSLSVVGLGAVVASYASIDPDLYWHRVLGQVWIDRHSLTLSASSPDPIAYTDGVRDWFPTAWLPEVAYAVIVGSVGYVGVLVLRLVLVVSFYALIIRFLHRRFPPTVAVPLLVLVGLPAATALQDRPQTLSLVLIAALLPAIDRWKSTGHLPRPAATIGLTWAWANVHGLWMLVPAFLVLAFAASLLGRTPRWQTLATAGGAVVAAAFTPVGPRLLLSPFLVGRSTAELVEWQPTALAGPVSWGLSSCLLLSVLGWARVGRPAPAREVLLFVSATAFGVYAYRNAVFASLLLLPLAGPALEDLTIRLKTSALAPRSLAAAFAAAGVLALGAFYVSQPLPPDDLPSRIAADLRARPGPVRVMPPYNVSGYLREFGGAGVRVAIDGRSDRYGNARIKAYNDAMAGRAGWRKAITSLRPDVIVTERESALTQLLPLQGWHRERTDRGYVLWDAP